MLDISDERNGGGRGYRWIKCFAPNPHARLKLVCFPFAGGGANFYRNWPNCFGSDIEVIAIQLPGRETRLREPCVDSAEAVSAAVIDELIAYCSQHAMVFFGHSMGSMLAYDAARRLKERHGWEPKALIVSGRQPPNRRFGGNFHLQQDDVFIEEVMRLNGTPAAIFDDDEMRRLVVPMLRSDYMMLETYRVQAGGLLSCPVVTCVGDRDSEATPDEMTGWKTLTAGPCVHRDFDGDHFYLKSRRSELTQFMNEYLMTNFVIPGRGSSQMHSGKPGLVRG